MHSLLPALTGFTYLSFLASASPFTHLKPRELSSRAPAVVPGWDYSGCFKDTTGKRVLDGASYASDAMTLERCGTFCGNSGFTVFGVEYGRECWCGTSLRESVPAPEEECSFKCPGKEVDSCGAGDRLNVYHKQGTVTTTTTATSSPTSLPTSCTYQNCYSEAATGRALALKYATSDTQTIEKCAASCAGFKYFGLEYYFECFCGNELGPGSIPVGGAECSYPCNGDATQTCGGSYRLSVYSFGDSTPPIISSTSTIIAPVTTPTVSLGITALGCFSDSTTSRSLKGAVYFDDFMTIEKCFAACNDYELFGVEYGSECYCGDKLDGSKEALSAECNMPCSGNNVQLCGAGDRLNVYKYASSSTSSALVDSSTLSTATLGSTTTAVPETTTTSVIPKVSSTSQPSATIWSSVILTSSATTSTTTTATSTLTTTTTTLVPAPTNILRNPGFESGLAPWTVAIGGLTSGLLTTIGPKESIHALRMTSASNAGNTLVDLGQPIPIVPGGTYTVDFWANRIFGQCYLQASLSNRMMVNVLASELPLNTWTQGHGQVTMPANNPTTGSLHIMLFCPPGSGGPSSEIAVDDVHLLLISTPSASTTLALQSSPTPATGSSVLNGGFENGLLPWSYTTVGVASILDRPFNNKEGSHAFQISMRANNIVTLSQPITISPGRYTLSFYIIRPSGECGLTASIGNISMARPSSTLPPLFWILVTKEITYSGNSGFVPLNIQFTCPGSTEGVIAIDDIRFDPIVTTTPAVSTITAT